MKSYRIRAFRLFTKCAWTPVGGERVSSTCAHVVRMTQRTCRPSERATSSIATLRDFCGEGGSVEQVDCDLQDFASVRGAAEALITKTSATGLHGLLNNAGVNL